jgi:hypothetical protein
MNKNVLEEKNQWQERREYLAHALNALKDDYSRKAHGDALTIIGPLIDALATAAAANILNSGSSSLLLSLRIALIGIEKDKSQAGVIGKTLSRITKGIVDLVIRNDLEKENVGRHQLFEGICQVLLLATISIGWKLSEINLCQGPQTGDNKAEDQRQQLFGFELILLLILKTEILELIVKNAAAASGAKPQQQASIAKMMKSLMLFLALLTAAKGSKNALKTLALDLKEDLVEGLLDIQNFINQAVEAEKSGDKAAHLSLFIQQAIVSLQEEDFDTLLMAYEGALELIQATSASIETELEEVRKFGELLYNAWVFSPSQVSRSTATMMI